MRKKAVAVELGQDSDSQEAVSVALQDKTPDAADIEVAPIRISSLDQDTGDAEFDGRIDLRHKIAQPLSEAASEMSSWTDLHRD